ncbi:MAG: hypothetical protein GY798_32770 [Hyphomicrobiales bacterium]|nr:hypothetical protein [Hyphomicrobiales bacterium]
MHRAILFDLDETLFDRTGSLRVFLADQHARHGDLGSVGRDDYVDRFIALDGRGLCAKSLVYPNLLSELGIDSAALPNVLPTEYERDFWRFARPFAGNRSPMTRAFDRPVASCGRVIAAGMSANCHKRRRASARRPSPPFAALSGQKSRAVLP